MTISSILLRDICVILKTCLWWDCSLFSFLVSFFYWSVSVYLVIVYNHPRSKTTSRGYNFHETWANLLANWCTFPRRALDLTFWQHIIIKFRGQFFLRFLFLFLFILQLFNRHQLFILQTSLWLHSSFTVDLGLKLFHLHCLSNNLKHMFRGGHYKV